MNPTAAVRPPGLATYGGLFFTTFSTLMYEILLTRIFSVTMWYHFAFVAVSVALFGMTVGALIVHLAPRLFPAGRTNERLGQAALLFSLSMVASFVVYLQIPFDPKWSLAGVSSAALVYGTIAVPFVCSGVAVCLALTRFAGKVGRLYAADLAGAALGTLTLIWLFDRLRDGPSAVLAVAAFAAVGAGLFALRQARRWPVALASLSALLLFGFAAGNAVSVQRHHPILRIVHVKGGEEEVPIYETWNAFSRIRVFGDPMALDPPASDHNAAADEPIRALALTIDATAGTTLTHFDGDRAPLERRLRNYVVNMAHFIRPGSKVAIVGTGGGWDILAAMAFGQPSITGIEMNGAILNALNNRYGDFTGHLDRQPGIRFVNDEARSYLTRTDEPFDIINIPMTDTWAATAAGAFALTENNLYTVEAWESFYDHLTERGVLSVTRWFMVPRPVEAYRLTALAAAMLRSKGVERPRDQIAMVRGGGPYPDVSVATILVSRHAFSASDVATLERVSNELGFELVLAPGRDGRDPLFAKIAAAEDAGDVDLGFPADIRAPTDNRPFFFQMIRFRDVFDRSLYGGLNDYLARPVLVLFSLGVAVLVLTALCILLPLALTTSRRSLAGMWPFVLFFCGIGLGFLLIEISQMQRLAIFLGHPTYALSVVLFSLLLSSGLGSLALEGLVRPGARLRPHQLWPLAALLVVLVAFGFATPGIIDRFDAETTPVRIIAAAAILAPMGLVMGMPFPLGMKLAAQRPEAPMAFFWGINGATSVCASVLAVAISLGWGISMAFWAGCLAYAVAAVALSYSVLRPSAI